MNMRKIGGKRPIGTGKVRCNVCHVIFDPKKPHPDFEYEYFVLGFPIRELCPHSGEQIESKDPYLRVMLHNVDWAEIVQVWV